MKAKLKINFKKNNGLVPVIIQNYLNMKVLMLGYMNEDALLKTQKEGKVTFYSRTKKRLWTKGETSGNFLNVVKIYSDCDNDTILIQVIPEGNTCHKKRESCFGAMPDKGFLYELEKTISDRIECDAQSSYTNNLFKKGINKVSQKVGEEAVELVIEANRNNKKLFKNEAADLLYHLIILLKSKNIKLVDIERILKMRS
ncbi:MAG: bifunctional phosphoribosyl-AMP cyclohydrolase/phosphoribosyl-ATP diphosphatase HisIE [Bacteroidetes bacterium]|nr:bifunctional phosphoribosyl-AMP cyclohydrolase/phosphoribosyl-ATP diphosphatase HisIE [Bacteroidota bacterium]